MIEYEELLNAYNQLEKENKRLKEKIMRLKNIIEQQISKNDFVIEENNERRINNHVLEQKQKVFTNGNDKMNVISNDTFNKYAPSDKKIELFMSLFHGREDVFAKRFNHSKTGKPGYAPVKSKPWEADSKEYIPLSPFIIEQHLRGDFVVGIFPICLDDSCYFLVIDLDEAEWQRDAAILSKICKGYQIPIAVERSRSGNGAHIWFFFEEALSARIVRKMGTLLITAAMSLDHKIDFKSYDRLFPNQDTLPKGGFGNLIALPLQKKAREYGNSVFVNQDFQEYEDQWHFLSQIKKITENEVNQIIQALVKEIGSASILPVLNNEERISNKQTIFLEKIDFPEKVICIKMNQLYIKKEGISQKALSVLKRMAAFQNPEFYQAQAMRKSTWRIQRMISCSDENEEYLVLPRGLKEKFEKLLRELKVSFKIEDKSFKGNKLAVSFNGTLRTEQKIAVEKMLTEDTGILCGTTAFGKTIAALTIIAERKVNTLILVNKTSLVDQWHEKINEFLVFENEEDKIVGQLGGGKKKLTNKVDIALLQSMYRKEKVHESIYNYGMIIVDECHHISAFSFEKVLKQANAKYIYGLTATPTRKDGHEPIVFMQCGPIRYKDDAKKQTNKRPFEHTVITQFIPLISGIYQEMSLQEIYQKIAESDVRNEKIINDVISCYREGRNSIVLTERVSHVEALEKQLIKHIPNVIAVTGAMGKKKRTEMMRKIKETPANKPLTIISTGKYIGEGFDEPRLDTLFLAMPISFKGRVQQYAGRLHRLYDGKMEVRIYDYCDIHIPVLERMYQKRLSSYLSIGYQVNINENGVNQRSLIYTKDTYFDQLKQDVDKAEVEINLVSPTLSEQSINRFEKEILIPNSKTKTFSVMTSDYRALKNINYQKNQKELSQQLKINNVLVSLQIDLQQHCVIIDSTIVWYGNIDVLGQSKRESSFIRLESPLIAKEIKELLEKKNEKNR